LPPPAVFYGPAPLWICLSATHYLDAVSRPSNLVAGAWLPVQAGIAAFEPLNAITDAAAPGPGPWIWRIELE